MNKMASSLNLGGGLVFVKKRTLSSQLLKVARAEAIVSGPVDLVAEGEVVVFLGFVLSM